MLEVSQREHRRDVMTPKLQELREKRKAVVNFYHRGLANIDETVAQIDVIDSEKHNLVYENSDSCDCKFCKFSITMEEWKTGKMSNGAKVGKSMRKAGVSQRIIDFYSLQTKEEKEVYLTISDLPQHIVGMSYYCEMGEWDGMGGSSCQDTRHDDEHYPIQLGGSLHDKKLFIGMMHDKLEDLEDMEEKLVARTMFRYVTVDGKPTLIATTLYGNNDTKDLLKNALNSLEEQDIYYSTAWDGNWRVKEDVREDGTGGSFEMVVSEDVYIYETIEEDVTVDCPLCNGNGEYEVYSDRIERHVEVDCPACGGSGSVETMVSIDVDTYVTVEDTAPIKPYAEKYSHCGHYVEMNINTVEIAKSRIRHEMSEEELKEMETTKGE